MKKNQNKWIVLFIMSTILITIGAQIYINIQNYHANKDELIIQVQNSLDTSVEKCYLDLMKKNGDTILQKAIMKHSRHFSKKSKFPPKKQLRYLKRKAPDFFDRITSRLYMSYLNDSINLIVLDSFLKNEFEAKHLNLNYGLIYKVKNHGQKSFSETKYNVENISKKHIRTHANTPLLHHRDSRLEILFSDITYTVLKKSIVGILLSVILSISIISCLIYLLNTINKQKKAAEIKNALISNITHEFKTPIATVSAALEGVKNFNKLKDPEKTEKYLNISSEQLQKLNIMVEKILETATLQSDEIHLDFTPVNINSLFEKLIHKRKILSPETVFNFHTNQQSIVCSLDEFHFENSIDNILDNAIKYGGSKISIDIIDTDTEITIEISDNGIGIDKKHAQAIFEQFYRVPTGNIHNAKGFGIGLYYTKKIIEKSNGTIELNTKKKQTTFTIILSK